MVTRRKLNIQAKKRLDWRDEDLPIFTRVLVETGYGMYEKRPAVLAPDEMQDMCQDSLKYANQPGSGFPDYKSDPSYSWAETARRKRR